MKPKDLINRKKMMTQKNKTQSTFYNYKKIHSTAQKKGLDILSKVVHNGRQLDNMVNQKERVEHPTEQVR